MAFPCVIFKLKSYFSFKIRCSMSILRLVSYKKKFLYFAVGAPGSTHDARILRNSAIYQKIITGHTNSWESDRFRTTWKNTFGDCWRRSLSVARLVDKGFPRRYVQRRERYFNKNLCSARVVCENAYGMLKEPFRILTKRQNADYLT